jgi:hypothetical protein
LGTKPFIRGDNLKEAIDRFHQADRQPGRKPGERALALRQLLRRFTATRIAAHHGIAVEPS